MSKLIIKMYIIWLYSAFICSSMTCVGCSSQSSVKGGGAEPMDTYMIGRFRVGIPLTMKQKNRSEKLRYVEIEEFKWPEGQNRDHARTAEWTRFWGESESGLTGNVISSYSNSTSKNWVKGQFVYDKNYSKHIGVWVMLVDAGAKGVWLRGEPSVVEKETSNHLMARNIQGIAQAYEPLDLTEFNYQQQGTRFYLQSGAISLPYLEQEESIVRYEDEQLGTLLIEMHMDFTEKVENVSHITGTRAMIAASLFIPGGSVSKIRLRHRTVAGMSGEESVLRIREGDTKDLLFTWKFNGKDDSGEYPTTRIEMESPDGNLDEKLQIWDAILDSMKPMFERKS